MRRRVPWLVLGTSIPAAVLIVGGFLGTTPFGLEMFLAGNALLATAAVAQRRSSLQRS